MSDSAAPWWRDAVMYQVYLRSFADGTGDGIGDLPGVRARLSYLRDLGVDGLLLTPWYPSPMKDGGYDAAAYSDIEPLFGTMEDARGLLDDAHALGLKVIVDFVANHLNWDHPGVRADMADLLRFWFDFGLDGLRMDAASGPAKEGAIADSYPGDRYYVGEVVVNGAEWLARSMRPDELHTTFNFDFLKSPLEPERLRRTIDDTLAAFASVGAPPTWTLSNHDETRHVTRYGRAWTGVPLPPPWPFPDVDVALGTRRARAMLLLLLALPGSVFLYQGEELGLWEVEDLTDEYIFDPVWASSGGRIRGRDGCRVPIPWSGTEPPFGFTTGTPWLPQPAAWRGYTAEAQAQQPGSMLAHYRAALAARRTLYADMAPTLTWLGGPDGVLAFSRGNFACTVNLADRPVPAVGPVLLSSAPVVGGVVPPEVAVWTSGRPGTDQAAQHAVHEGR